MRIHSPQITGKLPVVNVCYVYVHMYLLTQNHITKIYQKKMLCLFKYMRIPNPSITLEQHYI